MNSIAHELEELAPTIAQPFDEEDLGGGREDGDLDDDLDVADGPTVSFGDSTSGHVLGLCKPCKTNTMQVVIDRAGDTVIRSQCNVCGSEHAYRAPKREKARPVRRKPRKRPTEPDPATFWAHGKAKLGDARAQAYSIKNKYEVGEAIDHPKFGLCFVVEICSPTKISVALETEFKRLVCNLS